MKELEQQLEDIKHGYDGRAKAFAMHKVGAALVRGTLRNARGWFTVAVMCWRHDKDAANGLGPLGEMGPKAKGMSVIARMLDTWSGEKRFRRVTTWKEAALGANNLEKNQSSGMRLIGRAFARATADARRSFIRNWVVGMYASYTVLRERGRHHFP